MNKTSKTLFEKRIGKLKITCLWGLDGLWYVKYNDLKIYKIYGLSFAETEGVAGRLCSFIIGKLKINWFWGEFKQLDIQRN